MDKSKFIFLKANQQYSEDEIEEARCPRCNKFLELQYHTKPDNNLISAVCCKILYGIYPSNYHVLIDKIS